MNGSRIVLVVLALAFLMAMPICAQNNPSGGNRPLPGVNQPLPKATASAEDMRAGTMKLVLRKGLELEGTPSDLETIKMNSLFGEASIPLHTIAGIRFAQDPGEQTTVVLLNGDALTGEITLADVKFVSEWGEAKVNVAHLASIVFHPDFTWSAVNTPTGKRWQLTRVQTGQQINNSPGRVLMSRPQ
jgi:hypothetical protein